jgi:hypothetical protein
VAMYAPRTNPAQPNGPRKAWLKALRYR